MTSQKDKNVRSIFWKLAKISLALGFIGTIILYTPILEILYYFFYVVVIPLTLLGLVGMMSSEIAELLQLTTEELRYRITQKRKEIYAQAA